jgi:hypothetical protein
MQLKALTSLRSFFRPVLRFLGMSSPPPEVEFPNNHDSHGIVVDYWKASLLRCYRSEAPEEGPKDRSRMKNLKVESIRRYKEKEHVEHDSVGASLCVAASFVCVLWAVCVIAGAMAFVVCRVVAKKFISKNMK